MPDNPQDPGAPAPDNPYIDLIQDVDQQGQQRMRRSFQSSSDTSPEQAATARRLSLKFGVPPEQIRRNLAEYQKKEPLEQPFDQIHTQSPKLSGWLEAPENAAVAKDDLPQLGLLEWLVTAPQRAFAQTINQQRYSELRYKSMFGDLNQQEHDALESYRYQMDADAQLGKGNSWFRGAISGTASFLANQAPIVEYGLKGTAYGAAAGLGAGLAAGPAAPIVAGVTAPTAAAAGGAIGLMYGVLKSTFQQESANAYDEFTNFRDELGRPLDPHVARAAALAVGAINAPIEAGAQEFLLKSIPGISKLSAGAARRTVLDALRKPTIRAALLDASKSYAKTLAAETGQEVAQRAVTILGGELAKATGKTGAIPGQLAPGNINLFEQPRVANQDGTISTVDSLSVNIDGKEILLPTVTQDGRHFAGTPAERTRLAVDEYKRTGRNLGTFESPAAADAFAQQLHNDYAAGTYDQAGKYRSMASIGADLLNEGAGALQSFALGVLPGPVLQFVQESHRASIAAQQEHFFKALGEGVANSQTMKRSPEAMQHFVAEATKDGPLENVYAPVETWAQYWQDKGQDPAAIATEVTGSVDAYQKAVDTGEDLVIPTARYASKLAATEHNSFFAKELRFQPGEMNARESAEFQQQAEAQAEKIINDNRGGEITSPVRDALTQQLIDGGQMPAATAGKYVNLWEKAFGTLGKRENFDPQKLYGRYGVELERPDGAEAAAPDVSRQAAAQPAEPTLYDKVLAPLNIDELRFLDRRQAESQGPDGVERRAPLSNDPAAVENQRIDVMENIGSAARQMLRDPTLLSRAAAMRRNADAAGRQNKGPGAAAVDAGGQAAHTTGDVTGPEDSSAQPSEAGRPSIRRIEESTPLSRTARIQTGKNAGKLRTIPESATERDARRVAHYSEVFDAVLRAAKQLDPTADEAAIRKEFNDRVEMVEELDQDYQSSGSSPRALLEAIARYGGISLEAEESDTGGGLTGELKWLRESTALGPFGSYAGVRGVFQRLERGSRGLARTGLSLDDMARMLSQDPQFGIEEIGDLLAALEDIARLGDVGAKGAVNFPGTEELRRRAGINPAIDWWKPANEQEFHQGLFDDEQPAADTLDTGEQQPRLPGDAGDVRNTENATPEMEAPFSLTSPVSKAKGKQETLFQSAYHGSAHKFEQFSLQAIGTGEGAQAYGWGLYFASKREVAEGYRDRLSSFRYEVGGHPITQGFEEEALAFARQIADGPAAGITLDDALALIDRRVAHGVYPEAHAEKIRAAVKEFAGKPIERIATGRVYTVDIPDDGDYLDWDKPVSEQSAKIRNALQELGVKIEDAKYPTPGEAMRMIDGVLGAVGRFQIAGERRAILQDGYQFAMQARVSGADDLFNAWWARHADLVTPFADVQLAPLTGEEAYRALSRQLAKKVEIKSSVGTYGGLQDDAKAASEALAAAGVPGIRYLDGFSRRSGDGTSNYVLFDDRLVQITEYNQGALTQDSLDAFAESVKAQHPELQGFRLQLERSGDIFLESLIVARAAQKNGIGSKAMQALTDFADAQGARITLTPAQPGDIGPREPTSSGRLVKFYKRFGFVENKGRTADLSLSDSMYRDPKVALEQEKRGAIKFGPDRQFKIQLFAKADLSTFLHESGHFFLEVIRDLAAEPTASAQIKADLQTINDAYFSTGTQTDGHERFARAFEAYLMEGKAPSIALQDTFATFRAWLVGIYRSLKGLNVELSDEIRGVMDRLLATDDEIADAQARAKMLPMFLDARAAGMTEEAFTAYRATVSRASQRAQEELQTKLLTEVHREQTAEWKRRREEIRADVERDVQQRREYVALAAIQRGTFANGESLQPGKAPEPMKLSRQAIVDEFGKDRLRALPRPYVYQTEGGLTPSAAAELFGFSSGDELLTALEHAGNMQRRIETETDRRMIAEHGAMLLDGTLPARAQAAIANESRDQVIRAEMRALLNLKRLVAPHVAAAVNQAGKERSYERRWFEAETKLKIAIAEGRKQAEIDELEQEVDNLKRKAAGGPAVISGAIPREETIAAAARNRIAGTRIRDMRPELFWSAARKAQQAAVDAAARQDFDAAILAQQQQLLNLALYREAEKAIDDADVRARRAKDLTRPVTRARIAKAGETFLKQIDGILARFEFVPVTGKELGRRADIRRWAAAMEGEGLSVELPEEVLDEARRTNYTELTYEELVGVTDGLQQIAHLAGLTLRAKVARQEEDYAENRDAIVGHIETHGTKREVKLETLPKDRRARAVGEWFASHTKLAEFVAQLDGYVDGGPVWESFMRPINEAATKQQTMHEAAAVAMSTILKDHYSPSDLRHFSDLKFIPALGAALSHEGRIAVALNWGNEGNRQRLMESGSRKWSAAQVQAILATLDQRDLAFVQKSLDYINSYWPEIEAKQKRVFGIAPEKIDAASWIHPEYGEQRGGYYPIAYDGRLSVRQGNIIDADAAGLQKHANYAYATTKRGYTKAREERVNSPIKLELSVMYEHVEGVIHDLSHHEILIDVGRLMGDKKVQNAIASRIGDIGYKQMRGALLDIALGNRHAATIQDRAFNWIKGGTTIAGLAWNTWTASQQWLGVFNGAARIGPKWVAKGVARMFRDASSMEYSARWVSEKSEMMRHRGITMNREIAELRTTLRRSGSWFDNALRTVTLNTLEQEDITASYLALIEKAQQLADVPVWIGGYEKYTAAGETEDRAIALADQAVIDSQSGGQIKDLAQVQRGTPLLRLFTTFYSYGNLLFNQTERAVGQTNFRRVGSVGQMVVNLLLLYAAPAAMTTALAAAFGKEDPKDEQDFLQLMGRELLSTAMNTMVGVREVAGAAQLIYAKETGGKPMGGARGYEGPTGLRFFSSLFGLAQQIEQHEADKGLLRATEDVAGILFHLPLAQVQRSIDGFVALQDGKTQNPAALLVGPPPEKK